MAFNTTSSASFEPVDTAILGMSSPVAVLPGSTVLGALAALSLHGVTASVVARRERPLLMVNGKVLVTGTVETSSVNVPSAFVSVCTAMESTGEMHRSQLTPGVKAPVADGT